MSDDPQNNQPENPAKRPRGRMFGMPKLLSIGGGLVAALMAIGPWVPAPARDVVRESLVKIASECVVAFIKPLSERVFRQPTLPAEQDPGDQKGLETGSIDKPKERSITEEELKKRLRDECIEQKAKDVETFTERRKNAYADHKKCLSDWRKPSLFSSQTAEQFCSPKWELYQQYAQDVRERNAKDCTAP